jgi:hypothetical protein
MTVTTAREMSDDQRVGPDEVPPPELRAPEQDAVAAMEQAATAGNLEQAPAILAAVGPGSS